MFSATVIHSIRPRSWWMKAIGRPRRHRHVLAAVADAAAIQRVDAGQNLDQCGFARAVLAEQRDDLAAADAQTHVVQRARGAELLRDAAHLQQRRSGRNGCYCSGLSLASGCHAFASAALSRSSA